MNQEMTYIYQVYKDGSFSKAAEHLFLTQPALSIAIRKIETNIGMPLFNRNTRPLKLTPAGEIYINTIKELLLIEENLNCEINDIRNLKTGLLRIGGSHFLNSYILPDVLYGFNRKFPGIQLDIIEHSCSVLEKMLIEKEIDLIFSCNKKILGNFIKYPAFRDNILLAVPTSHEVNTQFPNIALDTEDILRKKHLSKNCPTISLSEFKEIDFIFLTKGNNLYDHAWLLFQEANFEPKIKLYLTQSVTALHMAESGMSATFTSDKLVNKSISHLKFYKLDSTEIQREFYILLPKNKYISYATKQFIQYFQEQTIISRQSSIL